MKKITKEQLAGQLNGLDYKLMEDIKNLHQAKESHLLILSGYDDDTILARGAINRHCYVDDEVLFALVKPGEHLSFPDTTSREKLKAKEWMVVEVDEDYPVPEGTRTIRARFGHGGPPDPVWQLTTELPYSSFYTFDGGDIFSDGLVIDLDQIP